MDQFVYPAILTPDAKDGGFVVTFVDLPEAITQGETEGEALREAADCLEEAMANRIVTGLPIPPPSRIKEASMLCPWRRKQRQKRRCILLCKTRRLPRRNWPSGCSVMKKKCGGYWTLCIPRSYRVLRLP